MNNHSTDLIVALDFPRAERAMQLVDRLGNLPVIYKVGLDLFMAGGPEVVRELLRRKRRVFLDLKFHDIPSLVARAALQAASLHVEMFTVHMTGGRQMVRAVADELAEISTIKPKILGVTVLTSFDDVRWAEVTRALTGHAVEVADSVDGLAEHMVAWGADGIVCSAMEVGKIHKLFPGLYTVVPGIRPEGAPAHDQARIMTPAQAHEAGASAVIVGRPIIQVPDPLASAAEILKDLSVSKISA